MLLAINANNTNVGSPSIDGDDAARRLAHPRPNAAAPPTNTWSG